MGSDGPREIEGVAGEEVVGLPEGGDDASGEDEEIGSGGDEEMTDALSVGSGEETTDEVAGRYQHLATRAGTTAGRGKMPSLSLGLGVHCCCCCCCRILGPIAVRKSASRSFYRLSKSQPNSVLV